MSVARCALTGLTLAVALGAQDLLWRVEGQANNLERGVGLRAIGDVNSDGWEDLAEIIQARSSPGTWCCWSTRVAITSGRDGSILSIAPLLSPGEGHGQYSLARTGDMNGDGVPDYAYMSFYPANIVVRSGLTHGILCSYPAPSTGGSFGNSIAGDLDLNGDGRNDIVTSAPGAGLGVVYAYDNSGAPLYQIANTDPSYVFGTAVASLGGDLDGDGCDDFLVVGPDATSRGVVHVVSGRTGTILRSSYGEQPGDYLYHAIGCGDLDGDGMRDFAGSSLDLGNHCVITFSGRTGQRIRSYRNPSVWIGGARMGSYLAVGDMDHDGIDDILAFSLGSFLFALNGRTGDEMFFLAWDGYSQWPQVAIATCMVASTILAPPPGERYPVIVYGEYCWASSTPATSFHPGLIKAYRTSPPTARTYGRPLGTGGMSARMGMRELAGVGARFTLSKAQSGAMAFLVLGTSNQTMGTTPLPLSLGPFGLPGMLLQASADAVLFAPTGTTGIGYGYAQIDVALDLTPTGIPVFAQWLWFDPANPSLHGSTLGHAFRAR